MSYKLHFKQTKDSSVPTACNQNNSCQSHQSFKFKSIHYKKIFHEDSTFKLHPRSPCSAGFHALSFDHGSPSNQTWLPEHENQQQQGQFFPQSSSSLSSSTSTPRTSGKTKADRFLDAPTLVRGCNCKLIEPGTNQATD